MRSRVLPMSDDPVRTWVRTGTAGWCSFQEFMIRERAAGMIEGLEYRGAEQARASQQVLDADRRRERDRDRPLQPARLDRADPRRARHPRGAARPPRAPIVAVSPIVGGEVLKGPTAAFMAFGALECSADGVADFYGELLDGIVADEDVARLTTLQTDTRMDDAAGRARVAEQTLSFAQALAA